MSPSFRPPSQPDAPPPAPLATRVGSLLGAATLAAMVAAIPATARVAPVAGLLGSWLALAACALVPSIVAVALVRGAREGTRAFAGGDATIVVWAVATWAMTTSLALAAYGALLRAVTHHHALAGVTFGMGGLFLAGCLALVVRRVATMARTADPWGRSALVVTTLVALGATLGIVALRVARGEGVDAPVSNVTVDLAAFGIAAVALSRRSFVRVPGLARGGLPLALGVLVVGGALLARDPRLVEAIRDRAPLFAPAAGVAGAR